MPDTKKKLKVDPDTLSRKHFSVIASNCESVSSGTVHSSTVMRRTIRIGATVILGSECRDFSAKRLDTNHLYDWFQPGEFGSSESGCLVGVLKSEGRIVHTKNILGSPRTSEGNGIDPRSITKARVVLNNGMVFYVAAGHAPPARAPHARDQFMDEWSQVRAKIKGGDTNVTKAEAERYFKTRVVGSGVLWITVPSDMRVAEHQSLELGSDHPAEYALLVKRRPTKDELSAAHPVKL